MGTFLRSNDTATAADRLVPALPSAPLTPIDRRQFDYSDLVHWMTQMDQAIRQTRRVLNDLAKPMMPAPVTDLPDGDFIQLNSADAAAMA